MMKGLTNFCPLGVLDIFRAWCHLSVLICRLEQVTAPLLGQRIAFWSTLCPSKHINLLDRLPVTFIFI